MNQNRLNMKMLGDLLLALLITGAVIPIGLALMTQGGSGIRTTAKISSELESPTPTSTPDTVKDWETLAMPGDAVDLLEGEEVCPSPEPTPTGTSEPQSTSGVVLKDLDGQKRVLGEKIAGPPKPTSNNECVTDFKGPLPNKYKLGNFSEELIEVQVEATDAQEIIKTICMGVGQELPECDNDAFVGCAWTEITTPDPFKHETIGLVRDVSGLLEHAKFKFVKGSVKVTDPVTRNSAYTTAVYAAAPDDADEIDVTFKMSQYALGTVQKTALSNVHPKLLEIAENNLRDVKVHEIKHWDIFKEFLLEYLEVMNELEVPSGEFFSTIGAEVEVWGNFKDAWNSVALRERIKQVIFHLEEGDSMVKDIPLNGWDGIICPLVKDLVIKVYLGSYEGGTLSVSMLSQGSGTKDLEIVDSDKVASGYFFKGSTIYLLARADDGYEFFGWGGDCPVAGSNVDDITLNDVQEDISCVGEFKKIVVD